MVNLIDQKGYEERLSRAFQTAVDALATQPTHPQKPLPLLQYVHWDFHRECKGMRYDRISLLMDMIEPATQQHGFLHVHLVPTATPGCYGDVIWHSRQGGVIRHNCIDCLDRTNVTQSVAARRSLVQQVAAVVGPEGGGGSLTTVNGEVADVVFEHIFKNGTSPSQPNVIKFIASV